MSTKLELTAPPNPAPLQQVNKDDWSIIREQATVLIKSGFLPASIKTAENAIAIILQGRELGIGPMAALGTINVIQGKPTVSPQLMLALINRSGQLEDMQLESSDSGAVCMMKRKGRQPHTVRFGPKEAQALQLSGKDNYRKQAATMFQWRAVAMCARAVFPDVILGLYTPEEMGVAVEVESGEIIEANATVTPPPAPATAADIQRQPVQPSQPVVSSAMEERKRRGKSLAEGGTVSLEDDHYKIETAINGQPYEFIVMKTKNDQVVCSCEEWQDNVIADAAYKCEHIFAVKFFVVSANLARTPAATAESAAPTASPVPPGSPAPTGNPAPVIHFPAVPVCKSEADRVIASQVKRIKELAAEIGEDGDAVSIKVLRTPLGDLSKLAAARLVEYLQWQVKHRAPVAATN